MSMRDRNSQKSQRARARPPRQQFGDISPAVSQHPLGLTDDAVFLRCPAAFLHRRVQMVVPSLADLLPVATVHVFGDERPTLGAELLHQVDDLQRKCSGERGNGYWGVLLLPVRLRPPSSVSFITSGFSL